ncbi:MAG: universal stress protein [Demequina sp.]|uniref:universal stress protein n=1 Tax=Demequina sp. TaxID=2050685 RepID=UPI0019971157|nr:universal stress protein [Demequina sp.]MBC7297645.1 universal stress protein [Demequina sp.]
MIEVVLVAVNDSTPAFAAAAVAVEYAERLGARVHAVTVLEPWPVGRVPEGEVLIDIRHRREQAGDAALRHVAALGASAGVEVSGVRREGAVAVAILEEAASVGAGLIVLARVSRRGHALPYVGSETLRVLEFATVPVLVVPTHAQ